MSLNQEFLLKFIYSEKATKFCEISTLDLSFVVTVKSTVEISQSFVAFSEYMKFKLGSTVVILKGSSMSHILLFKGNWVDFFVFGTKHQ